MKTKNQSAIQSVGGAIATLVALFSGPVMQAQSYSLDWSNIGGGGGISSGGVYSVSGTIGQPDAGAMSGGQYSLVGGFWPGMVVPSSSDPPTLYIQWTGDSVMVSWAPDMSGFVIEETDDLTTSIWAKAPDGNPVTIPVGGAARFYRLRKP